MNENNWWSITNIDDSINGRLGDLKINSSYDSDNEEASAIPRGNPGIDKCSNKGSKQRNAGTSVFVIPFVGNRERNMDSGYGSSLSPTIEKVLFNSMSQNCALSSTSSIKSQIKTKFVASKSVSSQATKCVIRNILLEKLSRNTNQNECVVEFNDTALIKCCRVGKVSDVQEALNQLAKDSKLAIVNHQNYAQETALSVAIFHCNEQLITLLIKYEALPTKLLTMENNVLHLAASITSDPERRALRYLIDAINVHQHQHLFTAITHKNMFNCDVIKILQLYQRVFPKYVPEFKFLQDHIDRIQNIIHQFYLV